MKLSKSVLIIICILITANLSYSQTELNLSKSIRLAIENNQNLKKLQNSVDIQNSILKTKYGALFPTLTLNGGWNRSNQQITTSQSGTQSFSGSSNTTTNNYNLSLRSDVTLFNGFSNYESIDIARMNRDNYKLQYEQEKDDIVEKVIADYISILKNEQIVKINIANLEDSRAQLEKIRIFVEVGKKTMSDVYKQDVIVAQNELSVEQSIVNRDKSIAQLVFEINLPQDGSYIINTQEFNPDVPYATLADFVEVNSNVNALTSNAIKNREDYKSAEQVIRISEANLQLTRNSLLFPTVNGFASYGLSGDRIGNLSNSKVFTIGLTFSYPIFLGFLTQSQNEQAELTLRSSRDDAQIIKNQMSLDIKKVVLDLRSLLKQIEISDRNIKAAEQDRLLAEESYRVGLGILLDVQEAQTKLNNALIEKSNAVYNFYLAQKQLEYYQGILKY